MVSAARAADRDRARLLSDLRIWRSEMGRLTERLVERLGTAAD
jgi:hypothetical protein